MKFLLEFVTCCTPCRSFYKTSSLPPAADDTRSLVPTVPPSIPLGNRHYRSSKRWRTTASKSGPAADWRPSLNAISEDNAVVVVERGNRAAVAGSERNLKRKVSPTPRSHVRNRRSDDYARAPIQAIMPAFSPTPFMF